MSLKEYYRRITPEIIKEYTEKGAWNDQSLGACLDVAVEDYPDKLAVVDNKWRLTFSEYGLIVDRIALGMKERGIQAGDVIGLQTSNQSEYLFVRFALSKLGAITLSLPIALRQRELEYILETGDADGLIVPEQFGGFLHADMAKHLKAKLPRLKHVFIYRGSGQPGDGMEALESLIEDPIEQRESRDELKSLYPDPNADDIMCTTAGTTGLPKIFLRTHNSWNGMARNVSGVFEKEPITSNDSILSLAPLPQGIGYVVAVHFPAVIPGIKVILLEKWNPEDALKLIEKEKCTIAVAVPAQMIQMLNVPDFEQYNLSSLRAIINGGAPLPSDKATEFENRTGAQVIHGYGASDVGTPVFNFINDPEEKRHSTAGRKMKYAEFKIIDDNGNELPAGETGEIAMRGPDIVSGFYKNDELTKRRYLSDGFAPLGDLAVMDESGYVKIVGRKEEIIVRGGQNISPQEVENVVSGHGKVSDVAIVSYPDSILGERCCAFVVPKSGMKITLEEINLYLKEQGLAKYKFPERIEIIDNMPLSPGGKANKKLLKEELNKK